MTVAVRREGNLLQVTVGASEAANFLAILAGHHPKSCCPIIASLGMADGDTMIGGLAAQMVTLNREPELIETLLPKIREAFTMAATHAEIPDTTMRAGTGVSFEMSLAQAFEFNIFINDLLPVGLNFSPETSTVIRQMITGGLFLFTDDELVAHAAEFWDLDVVAQAGYRQRVREARQLDSGAA